MILARQVFQVKYGHMDEVLAALKSMPESAQRDMGGTRVLTDISGMNFTLVIETKAESVDAYWNSLQEMFKEEGNASQPDPFMNLIESGLSRILHHRIRSLRAKPEITIQRLMGLWERFALPQTHFLLI